MPNQIGVLRFIYSMSVWWISSARRLDSFVWHLDITPARVYIVLGMDSFLQVVGIVVL